VDRLWTRIRSPRRAGGEIEKYSFKVDLNKYVKGQKLAGLTSLNLHTNITDASWMNEVLSFRLYRDFGSPAPRTSYARVYVTVPGTHANTYLGLFSIVEDVDSTFGQARFGATMVGDGSEQQRLAVRGDRYALELRHLLEGSRPATRPESLVG